MWQKIKCWLGWHEWDYIERLDHIDDKGIFYYKLDYVKCKHCGEIKMIRKLYFIVLLLLLLTACKDCSKPTKTICEYWYPIVVPMVVGKVMVMNTIMTCGKFKEVPNECYKEVINE